jgi:hypothetical protein
MHLLFFIGVAEDDDVAIVGRPKKLTVEVVEEFPSELLISRGVEEDVFRIRGWIHHWDPLKEPIMLLCW